MVNCNNCRNGINKMGTCVVCKGSGKVAYRNQTVDVQYIPGNPVTTQITVWTFGLAK